MKTSAATPKVPALTARKFVTQLLSNGDAQHAQETQKFFKHGVADVFAGLAMGQVFAMAKASINMPLLEVEKLLESRIHEARVGAVSIMDWQARSKKTTPQRREELFELYLRRHDRINNWDLVDRSAPYVVGGYLADKPRDVLYRLARSENIWERRTAITSTYFFIRQGDVSDTFKIAELLLHDRHDLIHKATGSWLRAAGGKDTPQLLHFLDQHASSMPRVMLRYAIEHLDLKTRMRYMAMKRI
jgi:3-methyladenine DNA glycosylase AlkD